MTEQTRRCTDCADHGAPIAVSPVSGDFECPRHGARFDQNGAWIGGQRTSSLRSCPTTYDAAAGTLTIG